MVSHCKTAFRLSQLKKKVPKHNEYSDLTLYSQIPWVINTKIHLEYTLHIYIGTHNDKHKLVFP